MELTRQPPGGINHIQSVTDDHIEIDGETYNGALVVTADTLVADWPVSKVDEITAEHLDALLQLEPEVVLIGTGRKQVFLNPRILMAFFERGIGVEQMNTQAACRTFNVLISDNRKVAAALLPPGA